MKLIIALLTFASMQASASVLKKLPAKDDLARVAKAVGSQLADGNISTGTTTLTAGLLKITGWFEEKQEFEDFAKKAFTEAFVDNVNETLPQNTQYEVTIGQFVDGDGKDGTVHRLASAIMESNAYDTSNNDTWDKQARYIWAVLRKLPVDTNTAVAEVKVETTDELNGETQIIRNFILINQDHRAVQLFTIQGSM